MNHTHPVLRRGMAAAALFGALALGAAPAHVTLGHSAHGHPARIHNGSCDDLKGVAFELNGVGGEVDVTGNPVPVAEAVNEDSSYQVMRSETVVPAGIDDMLAEPRAVMVYQSDEDMTGIACGNLGGAKLGGELAVALGEVNVPGHTGFAIIEEDAAAPGSTTVTVYVGHALSPVSMAGGMAGEGDGHSHGDESAGQGDENAGHDDESGDHSHDADAAATPSA